MRFLKKLLVFYHVLIYHYDKLCWTFNFKTHPKRITRRLSVWMGRSERDSVVGMSFLGPTLRLPERTRTIRGSINFLVYLHFGKLLPSLKLTSNRPYKWMVGIRSFPIGLHRLFSGAKSR